MNSEPFKISERAVAEVIAHVVEPGKSVFYSRLRIALLTVHKDWKILKRYTYLSAESIVALAAGNSL